MIINRVYSPASKNTFKIKPISKLIDRYIRKNKYWIDPFANNSIYNIFCKRTNDLNPKMNTTDHLDALVFLKQFESNSIDGVLFDPPYSVRQIKECYEGIGLKVNQKDTRCDFYSKIKTEIVRILKFNGICITFGWNSMGLGNQIMKKLEILLVPHGGIHNDTICIVEKRNLTHPKQLGQY